MLLLAILWVVHFVFPLGQLSGISSPFLPYGSGILLGATCLIQFALSKWMDSRYEPNLGRNYYWMIWYPFVFWLITITATIVAFPKVLRRGSEKRARWVSPDRGIRIQD
jgi:biofilm PGA synthesis N-glycosyltransferase PgaC